MLEKGSVVILGCKYLTGYIASKQDAPRRSTACPHLNAMSHLTSRKRSSHVYRCGTITREQREQTAAAACDSHQSQAAGEVWREFEDGLITLFAEPGDPELGVVRLQPESGGGGGSVLGRCATG